VFETVMVNDADGSTYPTRAVYVEVTEPERLVFNVARAYRECRGEPYDAPIDTPALFRDMFALREHWGGQ